MKFFNVGLIKLKLTSELNNFDSISNMLSTLMKNGARFMIVRSYPITIWKRGFFNNFPHGRQKLVAVSYTHLTLPTILRV